MCRYVFLPVTLDWNEKSPISINDAILSVFFSLCLSFQTFRFKNHIYTFCCMLSQLLEHWLWYQITVRYSMSYWTKSTHFISWCTSFHIHSIFFLLQNAVTLTFQAIIFSWEMIQFFFLWMSQFNWEIKNPQTYKASLINLKHYSVNRSDSKAIQNRF